jgi:hypothetical protein
MCISTPQVLSVSENLALLKQAAKEIVMAFKTENRVIPQRHPQR